MKRGWMVLAVTVAFMEGCVAGRPELVGSFSGGRYADRTRAFAFNVPSGWKAKTSLNLFGKPSPLASFRSPSKKATVSAHAIRVGRGGCLGAAKGWLRDRLGAELRSEKTLEIDLGRKALPAARGQFASREGENEGAFSLFCRGSTALLLEGWARKDAPAVEKRALGTAVRSLAFLPKHGAPITPSEQRVEVVEYFTHEVTWRGQTLSSIARWFTGVTDRWKLLAAPLVNPELTECCANLRVGATVKIPSHLLVRRDPPSPLEPQSPPKPVMEPSSGDDAAGPKTPLVEPPAAAADDEKLAPGNVEREDGPGPEKADGDSERLPDIIPPS